MLCQCSVTKRLLKSVVCAVADYYFEIADCVVDQYGGKYFTVPNKMVHEQLSGKGLMLIQNSERVWRDEGNTIRYIKNRSGNMFSPIDEREFMWIKLSSKIANV